MIVTKLLNSAVSCTKSKYFANMVFDNIFGDLIYERKQSVKS